MEMIQGLIAPFTPSWVGVWVFATLGGIITGFIKIADIDNRLFYPFISKPLIGMTTGVAIAMMINGQSEPPPISLAFWAFFGSVCSTPIITGFLIFISDQNRQNEIYKSAQSKLMPWSKEDSNEP